MRPRHLVRRRPHERRQNFGAAAHNSAISFIPRYHFHHKHRTYPESVCVCVFHLTTLHPSRLLSFSSPSPAFALVHTIMPSRFAAAITRAAKRHARVVRTATLANAHSRSGFNQILMHSAQAAAFKPANPSSQMHMMFIPIYSTL